MTSGRSRAASSDASDTTPDESILELARALVQVPSRAGQDPPKPVIAAARAWLDDHDVPTSVLESDGAPVALLAMIEGARDEPTYCLNACLDTAPFGDESSWRHPPMSGHVEGGWLHGRGAADSKMAVAIFAHLAAELMPHAAKLQGRLAVLFDCYEHTGGFAGAKAFLADYPNLAGAMIGYPGTDEVVVGARGFYRTTITLHGHGGHSGSSHPSGSNAVEKAAHLVASITNTRLPSGATSSFRIGPSLSPTAIHGGESFSTIPDICEVMIDARLTPTFTADDVRALLRDQLTDIDRRFPAPLPADFNERDSWPAYRLANNSPVANALLSAARRHRQPPPRADVCGPSNIGNLLAAHGVDATCGFGVGYRNIHAANESASVADIPIVYRTYRDAARALLPVSHRSH
jgi:succinyl-diaminopimelate desuccinylase